MNDDAFAQLSRLYPELDAAGLEDAAGNEAPVVEVPAGTVLFTERAACAGFPLLISGEVRAPSFRLRRSSRHSEVPLIRVNPRFSQSLTLRLVFGTVVSTHR